MNSPLHQLLSELSWINLERAPSPEDFRGRYLLIDFWTYCCINCLHILPDLHRLEQEFGENLLVLGSHSAKFENEKDGARILEAVDKYGIHHPVANDAEFRLWRSLGIQAWPTFALVDPRGRVIDITSGEGIYAKYRDGLKELLAEAKPDPSERRPFPALVQPRIDGPLRFPGKILARPDRLFVSDSEHHRILVLDLEGREQLRIGSGLRGLKDGFLEDAQFHSPQGMALDGDTLWVADTENHALRRVDLKAGHVETVVGDGRQGLINYMQETYRTSLNSPWDLEVQDGRVLIAMAGSHQLYAWDSQGLTKIAGSGQENLVDGPAHEALLAQTSGLALAPDGALFFADSETSSLRRLENGQVDTLVGKGLFDFGMKDGPGPEAQLQHPLGLDVASGRVYVADSYNHAIRVFDLQSKTLLTLGGGAAGFKDGPLSQARFNEPNDVSVLGDFVFVADTNNHALRLIKLQTQTVSTIDVRLRPAASDFLPNAQEAVATLPASASWELAWHLPAGRHLNNKAPNRIKLWSGSRLLQESDPALLGGHRWRPEIALDATELRVEATLYHCATDGSGACEASSLRLRLLGQGESSRYDWKLS